MLSYISRGTKIIKFLLSMSDSRSEKKVYMSDKEDRKEKEKGLL